MTISRILRERCEEMLEYMKTWKVNRLKEMAKPEGDRRVEPLEPPKPDIASGLHAVLKVEKSSLATPTFQNSMKKCFHRVGCHRMKRRGKQDRFAHGDDVHRQGKVKLEPSSEVKPTSVLISHTTCTRERRCEPPVRMGVLALLISFSTNRISDIGDVGES
ncbi:MAG: hypothetical protein SGPRY_004186 [Prymnesium sp.]